MNMQFLLWAFFLIISMVVSGLCMRGMALDGIPYYYSLLARGFFCLLIVLFFSFKKNLTLIPNSIKTQIFRALLAGIALTFFTISYNWLTASAVSVLSNIDIPFLVILGPWVGIEASKNKRLLSVASIFFLVVFVTNLEIQEHLLLGLSTLSLGSILLCFGYLYIKKSMYEENEAVTILTPSLAIIFYGIAQALWMNTPTLHITPIFSFEALLSGASMFGAYYATMRLYRITDIATAEFPTLIASLVIQPFEFLFLKSPMHPSYFLSSAGFVLIIYLILKIENKEVVIASA